MNKFIETVQKINAVVFLLLLVGVGLFLLWLAVDNHSSRARRSQADTVAVASPQAEDHQPVRLEVGVTEPVYGHDTLMLHLSTPREGGKYSSGGGGGDDHNLAFLRPGEKAARWMFPRHDQLIATTDQLSGLGQGGQREPTRALYLAYAAVDTDQDGRLSDSDHLTLALARPDGSGLASVVTGVERVLARELIGPETLSIVYQKARAVRVLMVNLATFKPVSDQVVLQLPEQL